MNIERLKRLRQLLDEVETPRFDMELWGNETPCGTTCCALGLAACDLEFKEQGLQAGWYSCGPRLRRMFPQFGDATGFEAGEKFFDITEAQSEYLFSPEAYEDGEDRKVMPQEVIEHIDELLDGTAP
jgi:hypothetical protein